LYPLKENNKTGHILIPLNGPGVASYDFLANGDWHHFLFTFKKNGEFQIWIDGKSDPSFIKKLDNYGSIPTNVSDGFRTGGQLDELEIYNLALPENFITKSFT